MDHEGAINSCSALWFASMMDMLSTSRRTVKYNALSISWNEQKNFPSKIFGYTVHMKPDPMRVNGVC